MKISSNIPFLMSLLPPLLRKLCSNIIYKHYQEYAVNGIWRTLDTFSLLLYYAERKYTCGKNFSLTHPLQSGNDSSILAFHPSPSGNKELKRETILREAFSRQVSFCTVKARYKHAISFLEPGQPIISGIVCQSKWTVTSQTRRVHACFLGRVF